MARHYVAEACSERAKARSLVLAHTDSMGQRWRLMEAAGKAMHHEGLAALRE